MQKSLVYKNSFGKSIVYSVVVTDNVISTYITNNKTSEKEKTVITKGTNIGRKNERDIYEQAMFEGNSRLEKQRKKYPGAKELNTALTPIDDRDEFYAEYVDGIVIKENTDIIFPMLAVSYNKIKSPTGQVYIQNKLDGVRCIVYNDGRMLSRTGQNISKLNIIDAFSNIDLETYGIKALDGEVYTHGQSLQTISGNARNSDNQKVDYHIYDCIPLDLNKTFSERLELIRKLPSRHDVTIVDTHLINSNEIQKYYTAALDNGYEGVMIRNDTPYELNKRSKNLIKLKPALYGIYEIVDFTQGTNGIATGALILIVQTPAGNKFHLTVNNPYDYRKEMYLKYSSNNYFEKNIKGHEIKVVYDAMSDNNTPLRARANLNDIN